MNPETNYQKFKKHLRAAGLFYAFWRGIKYFIFLIKQQRDKKKRLENIISKGRIKIFSSAGGLKLYFDELEVTQGIGLNSSVNSIGLWTDSSFADWQILERGSDYFNLRIVFKNLPLRQIWKIKIENAEEISWHIEMETEERLSIDEVRISCLLPADYKNWINNYKQGDFLRLSSNWQAMLLDSVYSPLVGVRFPKDGASLPSLTLELQGPQYNDVYPLIQSSPLQINMHIIGFRRINPEEKRNYPPGRYHLFSGRISLFSNDYLLDKKIESLRQLSLRTTLQEGPGGRKKKISVLLSNLPWQKEGKWGVRAGSRWPHIKHKSEGNYLPFPFFLAYAASLLEEHNIPVYIIDALAEEMPRDVFIKKILAMNFDYLVVETSIPSFYDDLDMLEKINRLGIRIILCGPNAEIYKPQFLKEHPFIEFVLYGEYEFSLLELIQSLQSNKDLSRVRGLIYRLDKEVVKNPKNGAFDVNLLPWPHRKQLPMNRYWDLPGDIPQPSVQMLASRGCPFTCNFCLWPQVLYQGNSYRPRDVKDVVDEMEYLVRRQGFKSLYFDDDTFNIGKPRMLEFCRTIKQRGLGNIPWSIMARPDLMDEEILLEMKSAGLCTVKYGLESVCERLLEGCRKNMDFQNSDRMIRLTKDLDIKIHLTFTFGLAGETKESIQKSIDYALGLEPDSVQFSILTPFPGTRLFEQLEQQGRILVKDWSKYDGHYHCVFQPDNLSPEELGRAKARAYRLWAEHIRKKRTLWQEIKRFKDYFQRHGLRCAFFKTLDYLGFIWLKKKRYLDG